MIAHEWEPETIAEVTACYREAQATYNSLLDQYYSLEVAVFEAEFELNKATRLYERCLQETSTIPEHGRQLEILTTERDRIVP